VASTLEGLALVQSGRGNAADAEVLLTRALAIYDGPAGDVPETRPAQAHILTNLARVYRTLGKLDQAKAAEARAAALAPSR
jgi:tetratricopeptide (TPR) repeat protein